MCEKSVVYFLLFLGNIAIKNVMAGLGQSGSIRDTSFFTHEKAPISCFMHRIYKLNIERGNGCLETFRVCYTITHLDA